MVIEEEREGMEAVCIDGKVLRGKVMIDGSKIVLLWNDGELLPGTVH